MGADDAHLSPPSCAETNVALFLLLAPPAKSYLWAPAARRKESECGTRGTRGIPRYAGNLAEPITWSENQVKEPKSGCCLFSGQQACIAYLDVQ